MYQSPTKHNNEFVGVTCRKMGERLLTAAVSLKSPLSARSRLVKLEFCSSLQATQLAQHFRDFLHSVAFCYFYNYGRFFFCEILSVSVISWDFWVLYFLNFINLLAGRNVSFQKNKIAIQKQSYGDVPKTMGFNKWPMGYDTWDVWAS